MSFVLVTGGKGFLGRHLVSRLSELGETVRVFARAPKAWAANTNAEGDVIWGDIRDPTAVERAVKGVDVVVHLVSNFRKGGSDEKEAYSVNVEGTQNVLKACLDCGVKQLIHCSTIGVHGNVRAIPADEETAFNPGDLYQETKLLAEKGVWEFHRETGLPVTVIRPISMYGPGDRRMLKLFRMIKRRWFVMVGNGTALFQPAYIDDVVRGFTLCLHNANAVGEAFIIGGEEYLPLEQLVNLIAGELRVNPRKFRIPTAPVLWLAAACERLFVPFGIEPPLHKRRVSFFQNNRAFSIEKAKRLLGYEPTVSLRAGIQKTIRWYTQNGWL